MNTLSAKNIPAHYTNEQVINLFAKAKHPETNKPCPTPTSAILMNNSIW
jgi:hypothetical protein